MQIVSFVHKGVRIDLPLDKAWSPEAREAAAEARRGRVKEWSDVERPVLGTSRSGNWLYQRLLANVKRKQGA